MSPLAQQHSIKERTRRPPDRLAVRRPMRPVRDNNMSEKGAQNEVVSERQILTEFLRLYRSFPCLWDQQHKLYANREARDRAYEVLLEKYRLIHEKATLVHVKKKIENMRCAYRRDHKKLLKAKFQGTVHKPHLWYFDLLKFLNENRDDSQYDESQDLQVNESISQQDESYQEVEELDEDLESEEDTKPKKRKNLLSNPFNAVFMSDVNNDVEVGQNRHPSQYTQELEQPQPYLVSNEAEAFGRTVGFQLKELNHMQRIYAEKLISDVIFKARLGQLSADTSLSSNEDD